MASPGQPLFAIAMMSLKMPSAMPSAIAAGVSAFIALGSPAMHMNHRQLVKLGHHEVMKENRSVSEANSTTVAKDQ